MAFVIAMIQWSLNIKIKFWVWFLFKIILTHSKLVLLYFRSSKLTKKYFILKYFDVIICWLSSRLFYIKLYYLVVKFVQNLSIFMLFMYLKVNSKIFSINQKHIDYLYIYRQTYCEILAGCCSLTFSPSMEPMISFDSILVLFKSC